MSVLARWYDRALLPKLLNTLMKSPEMTRIRAHRVPQVSGRVLEIGVGSGLNLPFYQPGTKVFAVDPSEELQVYAREVAEARIKIGVGALGEGHAVGGADRLQPGGDVDP